MTCGLNCECKPDHIDTQSTNSDDNNNNAPDDIWADEEIDIAHARDRTTNDIQRNHYSRGYVDGITSAKESSLQYGFDGGFPRGAELGISVGKILARLISINNKDDENVGINNAINELNITNILDKQYFDGDELELKGIHPVIEKWKDKLSSL